MLDIETLTALAKQTIQRSLYIAFQFNQGSIVKKLLHLASSWQDDMLIDTKKRQHTTLTILLGIHTPQITTLCRLINCGGPYYNYLHVSFNESTGAKSARPLVKALQDGKEQALFWPARQEDGTYSEKDIAEYQALLTKMYKEILPPSFDSYREAVVYRTKMQKWIEKVSKEKDALGEYLREYYASQRRILEWSQQMYLNTAEAFIFRYNAAYRKNIEESVSLKIVDFMLSQLDNCYLLNLIRNQLIV